MNIKSNLPVVIRNLSFIFYISSRKSKNQPSLSIVHRLAGSLMAEFQIQISALGHMHQFGQEGATLAEFLNFSAEGRMSNCQISCSFFFAESSFQMKCVLCTIILYFNQTFCHIMQIMCYILGFFRECSSHQPSI